MDEEAATDWLHQKMTKLDKKAFQQFVIAVWFIWNGRNGEVQGEPRRPAGIVAGSVMQYIQEYNEGQLRRNGYGFMLLELEGDALAIIKRMHGSDADFSPHENIIRGAKA
ncbi:hypothetical protein CRYUN_Cryun03dG0110600 [Craigia yunnanensis]